MITKGTPPQWALDILERECKAHKRALPRKFVWKNFNRKCSSGFSSYHKTKGIISINAGTEADDVKLVLLHEIAHHITNRNKRTGHTIKFWRKAVALYQSHGLDMKVAYDREKDYKVTAIRAFKELKQTEDKNTRFKRVAEKRVLNILESIRILGNCSNKSAYAYERKDVNKIFKAIDATLKETKLLFAINKPEKFIL